MKRNMFGSASWGFREFKLGEQLACACRLGFEIHELDIANAPGDLPVDADDGQLAEVRRLYESYGIRLLCAATGNDFSLADENLVRADLKKVKRVIDICEKVEAKYLRIFAGFSPCAEVTGARWERMVKALNETAEYAKSGGVVPCIETHGGVSTYPDGVEHFASVTTDYGCLQRLLSEVDDSVRFVYDPANLYAAGVEEPEKISALLGDRICCIHCKEFVVTPLGHLKPAACGDTGMKWNDILGALGEFEGPVLMEYERTEDVEEGCRRSADFLKKFKAVQKWR